MEDLFIYWTSLAGILLISLGIALLYQKKKAAACKLAQLLSADTKQDLGLMGPQLRELHLKIGRIEGQICDILD